MLVSTATTTAAPFPLRIAFGGAAPEPAPVMRIDAPCLAGAAAEELFVDVRPAGSEHRVQLFQCGDLLLGCTEEPFVAEELAARTQSLYQRILKVTRGRHLYRIWNYLPDINRLTAGLENYRAFCQGRSLAFEATLGGQFQPQLPAASAVGCRGNLLQVIFVAGDSTPGHFENPEQVPAYLYPAEHGPRPPSFARATVARVNDRTWTFISGTSAIKGHETVSPGAVEAQLNCTIDNLRLMSRQSGLGEDLGVGRNVRRQFKVYLRHAADLALARARFEPAVLRPGDVVTYLHAEICRAALNVEIEATIAEHLA